MTDKSITSDLKRARTVRGIRQAKDFLRLTWRELAAQIPKVRGQGHVSHSLCIAWANGQRVMADEQINRVGQLIANKLTARYGREIAIRLTHNSPWRVTPVVWCDKCDTWHELRRYNQLCGLSTRRAK